MERAVRPAARGLVLMALWASAVAVPYAIHERMADPHIAYSLILPAAPFVILAWLLHAARPAQSVALAPYLGGLAGGLLGVIGPFLLIEGTTNPEQIDANIGHGILLVATPILTLIMAGIGATLAYHANNCWGSNRESR